MVDKLTSLIPMKATHQSEYLDLLKDTGKHLNKKINIPQKGFTHRDIV